ncbi:RING/U-box superfamily protein [Theobroma cacao]|uniref:RING-type E3 ubiquitin transferase n=1 Tax=Theobroma cacao TaxID=3641 RepID=A0A061G761_THECC|nr:RING/U-box superfamily protein [Theobroma cacao]
MAPFKLFFSLIFFFFLQPSRSDDERCQTGCGPVPIRSPFQIITILPENRCGYPGLTVQCKNETQKILTFPFSGEFRVKSIDYLSQLVLISDPSDCTAERLLQGFNYSHTPFQPLPSRNFKFFNCTPDSPIFRTGATPISCLSGESYSVVALPTDISYVSNMSGCMERATFLYPSREPDASSDSLGDFITLTWKEPDCQLCESMGGICQFTNNVGLDVGCFKPLYPGFPESAKYAALFVVASGVNIFGLIIYVRRKIKHHGEVPNADMSNPDTPQRTVVAKGLDMPTIEMYPTTLLDESLQLPKSTDNVCPMCLLEYQAKETLRTIPSCLHYFHANCIDEWLQRNATCPLCRS